VQSPGTHHLQGVQTEETEGTPRDAMSIVDSEGEHEQTTTVTDNWAKLQGAFVPRQPLTLYEEKWTHQTCTDGERVLHEYSVSYLELMKVCLTTCPIARPTNSGSSNHFTSISNLQQFLRDEQGHKVRKKRFTLSMHSSAKKVTLHAC